MDNSKSERNSIFSSQHAAAIVMINEDLQYVSNMVFTSTSQVFSEVERLLGLTLTSATIKNNTGNNVNTVVNNIEKKFIVNNNNIGNCNDIENNNINVENDAIKSFEKNLKTPVQFRFENQSVETIGSVLENISTEIHEQVLKYFFYCFNAYIYFQTLNYIYYVY
jgi:hypothetical protein